MPLKLTPFGTVTYFALGQIRVAGLTVGWPSDTAPWGDLRSWRFPAF
jgi:hypothetical protein